MTQAQPSKGPAPSKASRIPSLRSKGSHRGSLVGGEIPTRIFYESLLECAVAFVLLPKAVVRDAELIHSARREPRNALDDAVMALMARTVGAVSIDALTAATGTPGNAFRAVVRRIAAGDLVLRSPRPITHAALVALATAGPVHHHAAQGDPEARASATRRG